MSISPYMQRCHLCGQDWWDSHVCPHLLKVKPALSPDSVVALEGGYEFQRKRADAAEARLSKAIELLSAALWEVTGRSGHISSGVESEIRAFLKEASE